MQFIEFFLNPANMARLAQGDWLVPTGKAANEELVKSTGGKQGWDVAAASADDLTVAPFQQVERIPGVEDQVRHPGAAAVLRQQDLARPARHAAGRRWEAGSEVTMTVLLDKSIGCLVGAAVGDALGGATETALPEEIRTRFGGWVEGIAPPYHADWATARPLAPYHKGDGHITDDTLMTHALVRAYATKRDHLDAYDVADLLVPDLTERVVYIPDMEREAVAFHRLAAAERWLVTRLHHAHADPREAGVGNIVNCGAAMYMAPVGVVNAGDPAAAYAEAIEVAGAHQHSFGREAAGVFAAAVAAAMAPGATVDDVLSASLELARDGTRAAIAAVVKAAQGYDDWRAALGPLRAAVAAVRHGRRGLPQPGSGRPPAEPAARHRGAAGGARPARGRRRRLPRRRCWARSTTAGTPTPRPRWRVRSPARSGAPDPFPPNGRGRSRRRRGSTSRRRPGCSPRWRRRCSRWTGPASPAGRRGGAGWHEVAFLDHPGGPDRRRSWPAPPTRAATCPRSRSAGRRPAAPTGAALAIELLDACRRGAAAGVGGRAGVATRTSRRRGRRRRRCSAPARPTPTGCTAPGSAGRSAACWASRWRRSRARASGRSSTRPAAGRCPTTSPRWACHRTWRAAGRGTGAARRPAWSRTSTGCRRTTTSTSR